MTRATGRGILQAMRGPRTTLLLAALAVACGTGGSPLGDGGGPEATSDGPSPESGRWVLGYYAGYQRNDYPVEAIEWSGLTHLAVAFYLPRPDGSLDESLFYSPALGAELARSLVAAAHAHGRKALASVGGGGTRADFVAAASEPNRARLVAAMLGLMDTYGYDGIDLDWEPVESADGPALLDVVRQLRAARPGAVLTMPIDSVNSNLGGDYAPLVAVEPYLDQLNVMSYGMAGVYDGWTSWHSSALYHEDRATPMSIDGCVKAYVGAGIPRKKLGVGTGFFGLCYSPPVSGPLQELGGADIIAGDGAMSYAHIVGAYVEKAPSARKWDARAHVPYLSFGAPTGLEKCQYVTYEDPESIADKGAYVREHGLGGAMVWTVNQGYVPSAPEKNPLLIALRDAVLR